MCGCNQTPCVQQAPCGDCQVKDLGTQCVVYTGADLECINKPTDTSLTEILIALDEKICDMSGGGNTTLVNIGDGFEIYAGDDEQGRKEIKTLSTFDNSVELSEEDGTINFRVSTEWLGRNGGNAIFPENIIEFTGTDPNSGSPTFTPNVQEDEDALYWGSQENTIWKYDTATSTYLETAGINGTPFWYAETTTDAGGNKLAAIRRNGNIGINVNPKYPLDVNGAIAQSFVTNALLKAALDGKLVAAVAGTDYLTPTGSAAGLTSFPTLNQNTTGNAATVTTIPNLTGDVTSVGNTTTLGNTAVTPGTYNFANITVNSQGRITSANSSAGTTALADYYTTQSNTSTTDTTLYTYTLPANRLNVNGDKLDISYAGSLPNTNSKTISFVVAGTAFSFTSIVATGAFTIQVFITRATATTGAISVILNIDKVLPQVKSQPFSVTGWSSTNVLALTAQGTATADVTARQGSIKYIPAAL